MKHKQKKDLKLYCDNPQCKEVIETERIVYDEEHREIYHDDKCRTFAHTHRVLKSGSETAIFKIDYISRKKALELLRSGKLNQSQRLEERVSN